VELSVFGANLAKISHGAWLPLVVGLVYAFVMITWRRGAEIVTANRIEEEGPLDEFLESLCRVDPPIHRVPGTVIFLNPSTQTTPLALRAEVERIQTLHEKVLIVSMERVSVPRVDRAKALKVKCLGSGLFKVFHVNVKVGYSDRPDIPGSLALARKKGMLERNLDLEHASYLVSRMMITPTPTPGLARWRKRLFVAMARNAASPIEQFNLPTDRTVVVGSQVAI
jgi:KUP system potassium uptake protein